jgi:hypothetical protein
MNGRKRVYRYVSRGGFPAEVGLDVRWAGASNWQTRGLFGATSNHVQLVAEIQALPNGRHQRFSGFVSQPSYAVKVLHCPEELLIVVIWLFAAQGFG